MLPKELAQGISWSAFKMHILAGPPVGVEAVLVILAVLPLITNRNFRISLHWRLHFGELRQGVAGRLGGQV